jgi:hypothetical protein
MSPVIERAEHHNVMRPLRLSLRDVEMSSQDRERLDGPYFAGVMHQMLAAQDLVIVSEALGEGRCPWLLMKGPVVADLLYTRPELRAYGDLDVVVPPHRFCEAVERLEAAGGTLLDANWKLLLADMRGQVHLRMPRGSMIDLHWHVLNRGRVRQAFSVSTEDLLYHARNVVAAGVPVRTLDPATTLVHLCLHAALSGGDRLSWMKDIDRAVVAGSPPWSTVVDTARAWRARLAVAAMLLRASSLFGTPLPSAAMAELVPMSWNKVLRALDRAAPVLAKHGALSVLSVTSPLLRDRGVGLSPRLLRALPSAYRQATHDARIDDATTDSDASASRQRYMSAVRSAST